MKTINWNGKTWYYKIKWDTFEGFDTSWTEFYKNPTKKVRKWWLFGDFIEVENDEPDFECQDIENESLSKEDVKRILSRYLNREDRKLEIEKGEII